MTFEFSIPCPEGQKMISVEAGSSVVIVGANGGGKTRLTVYIENAFGAKAHRISAHRALTLNPTIDKISERSAINGLRIGHPNLEIGIDRKQSLRWQGNMAVSLLNDYDFLLQTLFADQSNRALATHKKVRAGDNTPVEPTKFEHLVEIWNRLLPHRCLHISGDDIQVAIPGSSSKYSASDLSDGERAIFYLIGQSLAAEENSLLIFDEPELHIHKSIMSMLWDELEAARQDCAFLYITHDLEFASSRVAQKFVISNYTPAPCWTIEEVPEDTGFDESLATLILGSRRPVLFVEGNSNSLDSAMYRCCFPDWTVIPRGSCEEVIHSVVTMRRNSALTRVTCSGIVDADDYDANDIDYLKTLGIAVLTVSEIENIILLPTVSRVIAESEGYVGGDIESSLNNLKSSIFETLNSTNAIDSIVARYCRRRIDRTLKKIDLSNARTVAQITAEYGNQTAALDIAEITQSAIARIEKAKLDNDLALLLAIYDNKGLMALAAQHLKRSRLADFENWLTRMLRSNRMPALVAAIRNSLPVIAPL